MIRDPSKSWASRHTTAGMAYALVLVTAFFSAGFILSVAPSARFHAGSMKQNMPRLEVPASGDESRSRTGRVGSRDLLDDSLSRLWRVHRAIATSS